MARPDETPAVSIVMASYGRLPLLKESLASALSQQFSDYEILVVDDGSDEATREWLRSAQALHDRLRVVFQQHQGVAAARARGVAEARGDLICILDSDDTLAAHALRRLTGEFAAYPETVLAYTGIAELRPNGQRIIHQYPVFSSARGMLWATLLSPRVPFKHSGTMFRRSVAIELGSYDRSLPCKIDIDLYLRFLSAGHLPRLVSEPLVDFRMHKNSVSRNRLLGLKAWFRLIDRYAPLKSLSSPGLKGLRTLSETAKWLYVESTGGQKR